MMIIHEDNNFIIKNIDDEITTNKTTTTTIIIKPNKELYQLFRKICFFNNYRIRYCPSCFYLIYKLKSHSFYRCKNFKLAYNKLLRDRQQQQQQQDLVLMKNNSIDNDNKTINNNNNNVVLSNRIESIIFNNLKNIESKMNISSSLFNNKWIKIMINVINNNNNNNEVKSINSLINYDIDTNFISINLINEIIMDNKTMIKFDEIPSIISKENNFKKIGTINIDIGIGLFRKLLKFIVIDDLDNCCYCYNEDNIWNESFKKYGIIISYKEMKNFFIHSSLNNDNNGDVIIKQSIMMIDCSNLIDNNDDDNNNDIIPIPNENLLINNFNNIDSNSKIFLFSKLIQIVPMFPEKFWITKLLHNQIFSNYNDNVDKSDDGNEEKLKQSFININIVNSSTVVDNLLINYNSTIYYNMVMAMNNNNNNNFIKNPKCKKVVIYSFVGNRINDDNSSNNNNDDNDELFLLIKFLSTNFLIIEKIDKENKSNILNLIKKYMKNE